MKASDLDGSDRALDPPPTVVAAFHAVYRTLGALFLPPDADRIGTLIAAVPELVRLTDILDGLPSHHAWLGLTDRLAALDDAGLARLGSDHTNLFLSGSRDMGVQPFESSHVPVPGYDVGLVGAEIDVQYRRAGLQTADPSHLPDHIAVELEFCAALCHLEGDTEDESAAARWRGERRSFLEHHLTRWLPAFLAELRATAPTGLHTDAAAVARDVTRDDLLLIAAVDPNDARVVT